jgi:hypothetical protein
MQAWSSVNPSNLVTLQSTVIFSVGATGSPPFDYQWFKDGQPLSGQTGAQLILTNTTEGDSGDYAVVVGNDAGTNSVLPITLTVSGPPRAPEIVTPPSGRGVMAGHPLKLTVAAEGTTPLFYQWHLNNGLISGATNAAYVVEAATPAHAGFYTVNITNLIGSRNTLTNPALVSVVDLRMADDLSSAHLCLAGPTGQWYRVEHTDSPHLPQTWQLWQFSPIHQSPMSFFDYDVPFHPRRFYRAIPVSP